MTKHVPNFITLLNLLSGFAATVLASKGYNEYAALLIIAGGIFDFCDGFAARLLKSYSDIGKELDSLADVVTFGIAPGAIVLNLLTGNGMAIVPAFILACSYPCRFGPAPGKIQQRRHSEHLLQRSWPRRQAPSP